jgi:hypothetical protein
MKLLRVFVIAAAASALFAAGHVAAQQGQTPNAEQTRKNRKRSSIARPSSTAFMPR